MPFERTWRGNNLTTTWNRPGSLPRSFNVNIAIDGTKPGANPNFPKGALKNGRGTSCGQNFTMRNGRYDLPAKTVSFDMIFDENHPPEVFSGVLVLTADGTDYSSISGTIKVKSTWLQGKPPMTYNLYSRYRARVTLH